MMSSNPGEEANREKRQGSEQAIELALEGKWEEAAALNRSLTATFPNDVGAWNRLGKSLLELGRFREASESYDRALKLDPVNQIARRNLERLSSIKDEEQPRRETAAKVAQDLFIEEVGKSGSTVLRGVAPEVLAGLAAGDEVYLKPGDDLINIENIQGDVLGAMEARLALRLLRLIAGGNRYAAAVKSVTDSAIEIIVKEIYRDPSQTRLSFPAVGGENVRGYIKESLLRGLNPDEDDEVEEETESDEWEDEPEPAEAGLTFTRLEAAIEPDLDDEEEE